MHIQFTEYRPLGFSVARRLRGKLLKSEVSREVLLRGVHTALNTIEFYSTTVACFSPMAAISVFLRFIKCDALGNVDASGILSRECYQEWLNIKRRNKLRDPEKAFRKAVVGHCIYSTQAL